MQLHFESDLDYQLEAIEAVCDLFRGQEACRAEFSVTAQAARRRAGPQISLGMAESGLGVGNRLTLDAHTFAENLARVQVRNGLPPSGAPSSNDFTVEMETGTGKTYVYLRTIFELHRRFDFTKFVIVVPSVAIKEGCTRRCRSPSSISGAFTRACRSTISSTIRRSSARCAASRRNRSCRS